MDLIGRDRPNSNCTNNLVVDVIAISIQFDLVVETGDFYLQRPVDMIGDGDNMILDDPGA